MKTLQELLQASAARHDHLCPRQVLGVRMGLAGLAAVSVAPPVSKPSGLVIVETDGCFVDGIEVATGATVGHRTLRVVDLGKIAATFVDVASGRSIRLAPRPGVRTLAFSYAPEQNGRYAAQLSGYQVMPDSELFTFQEVNLEPALNAILSRPEARTVCASCGEEIINEREEAHGGTFVCRTCAGNGYYAAGQSILDSNGAADDVTEKT